VQVDYDDVSITENTRASYPIESIKNAHIPCVGPHPKNIVLLCCDAFGVLPPVSRLSQAQAMYHFISGYTAKVAGTEVGVKEPSATFSACFGSAFLAWHPMKYASMLADKMQAHAADAWLVNTGWSGGSYGVGSRMSLKYTRAIIDAIHSGELMAAEVVRMPGFGLDVPVSVSGVPDSLLKPRSTWADGAAYDAALAKLTGLFKANMDQFTGSAYIEASLEQAILAAGPQGPVVSSQPVAQAILRQESAKRMMEESEGSCRGTTQGLAPCAIAASASVGRLDHIGVKAGLA
jgi:phosphoenolpyruvate carboxykinase (ATP)